MKGHGYVTLPSRLVGAVLGDSDVSTSAAWSTGHSAIHPLVTRGRGPLPRPAMATLEEPARDQRAWLVFAR